MYFCIVQWNEELRESSSFYFKTRVRSVLEADGLELWRCIFRQK